MTSTGTTMRGKGGLRFPFVIECGNRRKLEGPRTLVHLDAFLLHNAGPDLIRHGIGGPLDSDRDCWGLRDPWR